MHFRDFFGWVSEQGIPNKQPSTLEHYISKELYTTTRDGVWPGYPQESEQQLFSNTAFARGDVAEHERKLFTA